MGTRLYFALWLGFTTACVSSAFLLGGAVWSLVSVGVFLVLTLITADGATLEI